MRLELGAANRAADVVLSENEVQFPCENTICSAVVFGTQWSQDHIIHSNRTIVDFTPRNGRKTVQFSMNIPVFHGMKSTVLQFGFVIQIPVPLFAGKGIFGKIGITCFRWLFL
jgi:hypothetical protein